MSRITFRQALQESLAPYCSSDALRHLIIQFAWDHIWEYRERVIKNGGFLEEFSPENLGRRIMRSVTVKCGSSIIDEQHFCDCCLEGYWKISQERLCHSCHEQLFHNF